jgi:hypothetical protein
LNQEISQGIGNFVGLELQISVVRLAKSILGEHIFSDYRTPGGMQSGHPYVEVFDNTHRLYLVKDGKEQILEIIFQMLHVSGWKETQRSRIPFPAIDLHNDLGDLRPKPRLGTVWLLGEIGSNLGVEFVPVLELKVLP